MKKTGSTLFVFLVLVCLALGTGCSKPRVEMAVASQPNVNPDHSDRPSPVIVKIYELRNDLAFTQADFLSLFDTPIQVLGADLVAADELVFIPGEARRIAYQPNPNTRFIGVVAGFRQMDRAFWRVIKPVDPEEENWLAIELNDATIIVIPDKDAEDWDPEKAVRQFQKQMARPEQPAAGDTTPARSGATDQTRPADPAIRATTSGAPDSAAGAGGTRAAQDGKETVTIIGEQGDEALPGVQAGKTAPAPLAPPPPSMRSL